MQLFVPQALTEGRRVAALAVFRCVEEVSISYYEEGAEALLFSPCLSISPTAVCLLYCLPAC